MLSTAKAANLAVRFLAEVGLLVAVTAGAWQSLSQPALRWIAVVGAPVTLAIGWVALVHGNGTPAWAGIATQAVALLIAVAAMPRISTPTLTAALAGVALVNAALLALWDQ